MRFEGTPATVRRVRLVEDPTRHPLGMHRAAASNELALGTLIAIDLRFVEEHVRRQREPISTGLVA